MAFYKKRVVRPDTPVVIAWRQADNAARDQARAERAAAYPVITAENFEAAAAFQQRRLVELTAQAIGRNGRGTVIEHRRR